MNSSRSEYVLVTVQNMAVQIKFPKNFAGSAIAGELQKVICSCLHSKPQDRSSAAEIAANLHSVMQQKGWSSRVCDVRPVDASKASA